MSLLQENVYFSHGKVNKNAYFTLFKVNKNVNLVIFNMSKITFVALRRFIYPPSRWAVLGQLAIGYKIGLQLCCYSCL